LNRTDQGGWKHIVDAIDYVLCIDNIVGGDYAESSVGSVTGFQRKVRVCISVVNLEFKLDSLAGGAAVDVIGRPAEIDCPVIAGTGVFKRSIIQGLLTAENPITAIQAGEVVTP
jgi:hypothetical protein